MTDEEILEKWKQSTARPRKLIDMLNEAREAGRLQGAAEQREKDREEIKAHFEKLQIDEIYYLRVCEAIRSQVEGKGE